MGKSVTAGSITETSHPVADGECPGGAITNMNLRRKTMPKPKLCIYCRSAKPLDDIVGRCLVVKNGMQFFKLREPSHVCKKFKRIKEVLDE